MRNLRFSFWWLLCLLWAAKIFWLSTDTFSTEATRPILARVLESLHIQLSPPAFRVLHTIVRKSAHLFEYSVFTYLFYRALCNRNRLTWLPRPARWTLLAVTAWSFSDEFHQLFSKGRGPSFADCLIDIAGASLALLLIRYLSRPRPDRLIRLAARHETTLQALEDA